MIDPQNLKCLFAIRRSINIITTSQPGQICDYISFSCTTYALTLVMSGFSCFLGSYSDKRIICSEDDNWQFNQVLPGQTRFFSPEPFRVFLSDIIFPSVFM